VAGLKTSWDELPAIAVRFCLSLRAAQTVIGRRSQRGRIAGMSESGSGGATAPDMLAIAHSLALNDEQLLNPSFWRLEESDTE